MSVFSGKCDLCDHFIIACDGLDDIEKVNKEIERTDFYLSRNHHWKGYKLDIHNIKDLVPYYPFLVSLGAYNKEGRNTIYITSESFVDTEEKEYIGWIIRDTIKYYNKCKRNHIEFDKEIAYEKVDWGYKKGNHKDWWKEAVIDKVVENKGKYTPEDAIYDGIYVPSKDWSRKCLYDEMITFGYNENIALDWCFSYNGIERLKAINDKY